MRELPTWANGRLILEMEMEADIGMVSKPEWRITMMDADNPSNRVLSEMMDHAKAECEYWTEEIQNLAAEMERRMSANKRRKTGQNVVLPFRKRTTH